LIKNVHENIVNALDPIRAGNVKKTERTLAEIRRFNLQRQFRAYTEHTYHTIPYSFNNVADIRNLQQYMQYPSFTESLLA